MKAISLLDKAQSREDNPNADPLYVDKDGRVILFTLKAAQTIKGHQVPRSPFYAIVLKGHGFFAGREGQERRFGPNDLVVFDSGEEHAVRADSDGLVFVGILHGEPSNTSERTGGAIAHGQDAPARG